jgi:hypothetical protein
MVRNHIMDNRFFNEVIVHDEMSKLRSLLQMIPNWEASAVVEVNTLAARDVGDMSLEQSQWHGEHVNDRYYDIDVVTKLMFCGLAVIAASAVENVMGMFCREHDGKFNPKADWRTKRQRLEQLIGDDASLSDLPGFSWAHRARILANCFKHNGGTVNEEYAKSIVHRPIGDEIRYQDENWAAIIDGIQTALLSLVQRLPTRP